MESDLPIRSPFSVSRKDKNLRESKTWWDLWSVGKNKSKQKNMFQTGHMLIVNMITQIHVPVISEMVGLRGTASRQVGCVATVMSPFYDDICGGWKCPCGLRQSLWSSCGLWLESRCGLQQPSDRRPLQRDSTWPCTPVCGTFSKVCGVSQTYQTAGVNPFLTPVLILELAQRTMASHD